MCGLRKFLLVSEAAIASDHCRRHTGDALDLAVATTSLTQLLDARRAETVEGVTLLPDPACGRVVHQPRPRRLEAICGVRFTLWGLDKR